MRRISTPGCIGNEKPMTVIVDKFLGAKVSVCYVSIQGVPQDLYMNNAVIRQANQAN
jgi:hypothetical protein